ncbi:MAG: F0F1 ATP synthase subunit B [Actinobacteria bacterium]|nr:F0F1 ATP synthase subunit B [Actinomycetota bacterium]
MQELLKTLGFDPTKFIFTIVNFLVLFLILRKYLFKSILKALEDRKEKIREGLKQAELGKMELARAQEERDKIIADAKAAAEKIKMDAEESGRQVLVKASEESEKIIAQGRKKLVKEEERIKKEMFAQLIDFVTIATRKVLDEVVSEKQQQALVEKAVSKTLEEVS